MRSQSARLLALVIGLASLSACASASKPSNGSDAGSDFGRDSGTGDSGTDEPETLQCPLPLAAPRTVGCDGVLLTDAASIEQQSDGIATTEGPDGSAALSIRDEQSIDLKDEGCLQLGKDGADFSLSMWLKATGDSQIIGTTDQYGGAQGFVLFSRARSDGDLELVAFSTASASSKEREWRSAASAPFKPNTWTHVAVRYDNNDNDSAFTIFVNMAKRSARAHADVYNDKLRVGDMGWGPSAPLEVSELRSYGRLLSDAEIKGTFLEKAAVVGVSKEELSHALDSLEGHMKGSALLSLEALEVEKQRFLDNALFLETDAKLMGRALDLVSTFETSKGPLFMTEATKNGISRVGSAGDGLELERAMVSIQQAVLDQIFTPTNVEHCRLAVLDGRRFLTADYFPGVAPPPEDPTKSYEVTISADFPAHWGVPSGFATTPVRRPTGLYLSPGSIGKVTVPDEMIDKGYTVLVGAHTVDHREKTLHSRLDRVTLTFPITKKTTHIANPLGGGVYIVVPYKADLGLVKVSISNVIEAPFFSLTNSHTTTAKEWQTRRAAPAPWADFETDHYMMQLPRSWIYNSGDLTGVMRDWETAMEGVSELMGYPPGKRTRTVLYQQVDLQIQFGVYGVGYPQINNTYNPFEEETGNKQHWMLTDVTASYVDYHELGHVETFSMFRGETEASNNFLVAYVRNAKFGVDYDQAFAQSFGGGAGVSPDTAAIDWMVTENFRNGMEMDHSNTTKDQFRYQHRGYAKYSDIYKIFGWQALRDFYHQEHVDYMAKTPSDGLNEVDSRILRLSVAAKADLTPLIHFWGIHPVDPTGLRQKMADKGLLPSPGVKARIEYYKTIAPKNNADFIAQCDRMFSISGCPLAPNADPDWGIGWYNGSRDVFDETRGAQIQAQIQHVLDLYYP